MLEIQDVRTVPLLEESVSGHSGIYWAMLLASGVWRQGENTAKRDRSGLFDNGAERARMHDDPEHMTSAKKLARLWPHRSHESNWVKAFLCKLGLHRWHPLEVPSPYGTIHSKFCRWCPKVKVLD